MTLLLALLVLSALLAISFSLATVLLVEVRSSGDLTRSEASLYGSSGVSEQALFDLKRQVSCSGGCSYITNFSNNVTLNGQPVVSSVSNPTFTDTVKQNTNFASNPKIYDFCGTGSGNSGCGYGKVTVTYLPNGNHDPLVVYLCQYDPTILYTDMPPCSGTADADAPYWITTKYGDTDAGPYYPKGTLIYSTSLPGQTTWNIDPSLQQRLILFNPNSTGPIYVSIQTFAADGTTPLGLPYAGMTSVTVNTKNGDVGRKLQVLVPNSSSSGGTVNTTNYALAANGGVASASSQYFNGQYPASSVINGERRGTGWGSGTGGWNDNTGLSGEWLAVAFSGAKSLSEVDVYTLADGYPLSADPGPTDTFSAYGITAYEVQYSTNNGATWADVPGGNIVGNNLIWRKINFATISNVTNIRVLVHTFDGGYSRIVQVEAY